MEFITEAEIEQIGNEIIDKFIVPRYDELEHNASGELRRSLRVRAEGNRITFSGLFYAQFLIIGRAPNKDQSDEGVKNWVKWYAPNVFVPWLDAKGLIMNPYILANSIARHGTKKYREQDEKDFMDVLASQELKDFVAGRVSDFIKVNIDNSFRAELRRLRSEYQKS